MRIGLIGPARAEEAEVFREAVDFLLGDVAVETAIYLGKDETAARLAQELERRRRSGGLNDFLSRAGQLAEAGSPEEIRAFLDEDQAMQRLSRLKVLPPPPGRALDMVGERFALFVHDTSVLDEEDIANSTVIVFGNHDKLLIKRFGSRYFFCPGPLAGGKVGVLESDDEGRIVVSAYATTGEPLWREILLNRKSKLSVS